MSNHTYSISEIVGTSNEGVDAAVRNGITEAAKSSGLDQRARDNVMTFTMAVTFRPETIKPTPASP